MAGENVRDEEALIVTYGLYAVNHSFINSTYMMTMGHPHHNSGGGEAQTYTGYKVVTRPESPLDVPQPHMPSHHYWELLFYSSRTKF